ncbi:MAG: DUF6265 family protein [Thermoanaerobaculia bacterium]
MRKLTFAVLVLSAFSASGADFPAWMAGSWTGESGGVKMEEHWTSAAGGLMLGMHRDLKPNGTTAFEFLRVEQRKDGTLVYQAMPMGRPATPFALKTMTSSRVVFENLEHDFPQRIIYWRAGKRLCARVEGTIGGKVEFEEFCWTRAR